MKEHNYQKIFLFLVITKNYNSVTCLKNVFCLLSETEKGSARHGEECKEIQGFQVLVFILIFVLIVIL